ncbi:MAG: hypothetical protein AAGG09_11415 [Pseudomonadota bacterium]
MKTDLWGDGRAGAETAEHALQRLARSAPHLLADVGFEDAPALSSPHRQVLVRGAARLELWADGSLRFLPAG